MKIKIEKNRDLPWINHPALEKSLTGCSAATLLMLIKSDIYQHINHDFGHSSDRKAKINLTKVVKNENIV